MTAQLVPMGEGPQFGVAAGTLKLLADPTRLAVLWALLQGEHSVNQLAEQVGAQPASVSQHLAKLRLAGVVRTRRQGNFIYYVVASDHVRRLVEEAVRHADHIVHGRGDHLPSSAARPARPARSKP